MILALLIAWIFGVIYVVSCAGCVVEGTRLFMRGKDLNEKVVGLLISLLGILGLVILL